MTTALGVRLTAWRRALLVPVAVFLIVAGYLADDARRERLRAIDGELEKLDLRGRVVETALSAMLRTLDRELDAIGRLSRAGAKPADLSPQLDQRVERLDHVLALMLIDADGRVNAHTNRQAIGFDARQREHFSGHRPGGAGGLLLTQPFRALSGDHVVTVSRAIVDAEGHFRGVAAAAIRTGSLGAMLAQALGEEHLSIAVINPQARIILRLPDPELHTGKSLSSAPGWIAHRTTGQANSRHLVESTGLESKSRLLAFRDIGIGGLTVVVGKDTDVVLAPWQRQTHMRVGLLALFAIALATFSYLARSSRRTQRSLIARSTALAANTSDILVIFDKKGLVSYANPAVADVTGFAAETTIGKHFSTFAHREDLPRLKLAWQELLNQPGKTIRLRFRLMTHDRRWVDIDALATGHFDTPGIRGVLLSCRDISEQVTAEARLRQSEENLKRAQAVARVGSWSFDAHSRRIEWSDETYRIFGIQPGTPMTLAEFRDHVYIDDRTRLDDCWTEAIKGGQFDIEHRIVVTGKLFWIREKADLSFDAQGHLQSATGTVQDISAEHEAAARMAELLEFSEKVIAESPAGIAVYRAEGECVMANPAMATILGLAPEQVRTENFRRQATWRSLGLLDAAMEALQSAKTVRRVVSGHAATGKDIALDCEFATITRQGSQHLLLIAKDVAEFRAAERALKEGIRLAEESSRSKSEFLANVSHEIRTPMNAIVGLAQLALDRAGEPLLRDYLRQMQSSTNALLGVINDILDYSKIEAGGIALELREFDLGELTDHLTALFRSQASAKGLGFALKVAPEVPQRLIGDGLRLTQVLINLLGNAIKFTDRGDIRLDITALPTDGPNAAGTNGYCRVRFAVCDTGIGMDEQTRSGLFRPFAQGDGSITRRFGGTGLGLSISRRLVRLMGGDIHVESQSGTGSCFAFALDFAFVDSHTAATTLPIPEAGRLDADILLVDDDRLDREITRRVLEQAGLRVGVADNGAEALQRLLSHSYTAVLMDLRMPVMDGFATTRHIRANAEWQTLPIIALTAAVPAHGRSECLAAGMDDFIAKPVRPEELLATLCRHLPPQARIVAASAAVPSMAPPPAGTDSSRLLRLLDELQKHLDEHNFINAEELGELRACLAPLVVSTRLIGETLEAAIARYDYHSAKAHLDDLRQAIRQIPSENAKP